MMTIAALCEGIVTLPKSVSPDLTVSSLASDSRKITRGGLFAAIEGFRNDGHRFAAQAVDKGASVLMVEKEVAESRVPVLRVKDCRYALAMMAHRFYGSPSDKLCLVGVTGTNGKTTVAFLVESILKSSGCRTGLISTIEYRWDGISRPAERTTPDIIEMTAMLAQMAQDGITHVVMEVSSHALALHRVSALKYQVAIFTNLSHEHLDFHHDMEAYADAKSRLFDLLKKDGTGLINIEDHYSGTMCRAAGDRAKTYGRRKDAGFYISGIRHGRGKTTFNITYNHRSRTFSTPLWGDFNIMNTAAAAAAGIILGMELSSVQAGINRVKHVRGRMEGFDAPQGFRVVIDYAHTPDALANVLAACRRMTRKRVICLFGCGGDRDRAKRPEMGRVASGHADVLVVTSDNPRSEDPERIIDEILAGMSRRESLYVIPDRRNAIEKALEIARAGDLVLIAGKGHETYQIIGQNRNHFDDREQAEMILGIHNGDTVHADAG